MTSLFLLLWACAPADVDPSDPGVDPTNPTQPTQPGDRYEPVPMGVDIVQPETVDVLVDSVSVHCEGNGTATLRVDTLGHAEQVEVDLVHGGGIEAVSLSTGDVGADDVWVSFTGSAPCELAVDATWVVRAHQGGAEADCAVHGAGRDDVLAGSADTALIDAGRPAVAGCHDIAK